MAAGILIDSDGKRVIWSDGTHRIGEDGDPCCCGGYLQAHYCPSVGALADVWMTVADAATFPNAFQIAGKCYYFAGDGGATPGTLYTASSAIAYADCATCAAPASCPCPDASPVTTYRLDFDYEIITYAAVTDSPPSTVRTRCPNPPDIPTVGVTAHASLTMTLTGTCYWDEDWHTGDSPGATCGYDTLHVYWSGTPTAGALCAWVVYIESNGAARLAVRRTGNDPSGSYPDVSYITKWENGGGGFWSSNHITCKNIVVS